MIPTKEYNGKINVGDIIRYSVGGGTQSYQVEDIGYITEISKYLNKNRYQVYWFGSQNHSEEDRVSIKKMPNSYIIPICKK